MGQQYDSIQGFDISNLLLWNLICVTTRLTGRWWWWDRKVVVVEVVSSWQCKLM